MLDLAKVDLDEIAMALSDQTDYEHRWLIHPGTAGRRLARVLRGKGAFRRFPPVGMEPR